MLCNTESYYPKGIDPMIFFQDNDLEKINIINTYNDYIFQGKYTKASEYIEQQKGVYGYFADFFNAIENRIFKLQEYLLQKEPIEKQYVFFNESDELNEPNEPDIEEEMFWI